MLEDRTVLAAITITPLWDTSITSSPQKDAIEQTINTAINLYEGFLTSSSPVSVSVNFEINTGSITSIPVSNGGHGYGAGTQVTLSAPTSTHTGQQATATATIGAGGVITAINVRPGHGGSGYSYTSPPQVMLSNTGGGTGFAQGAAVLDLGLGTTSYFPVTVPYSQYLAALNAQQKSGNDMTALPTLPAGASLPAPLGGNDAAFTAQVAGGAITRFTMQNAGSGYDPNHPPAVYIEPPPAGGTQALAHAIVAAAGPNMGQVTGIAIDTAGTGYTDSPAVAIASPGGATNIQMTPTLAASLGIYPVLAATGSGAQVTFTVTGTGAINAVTGVAAGGSGYPDNGPFDLYVLSNTGVGGIVQATSDGHGHVASITAVVAAGSGYTAAPAAAPADVTSGEVDMSLDAMDCNISRPFPNPAPPDTYDFLATTLHELGEVLGAGGPGSDLSKDPNDNSYQAAATPSPLDLFRYLPATVNGAGLRTAGARVYNLLSNTTSVFSIDGGLNSLNQFNQTAGGDFGDWFSPHDNAGNPLSPAGVQVQDANQTPGIAPNLGVELTALDVIGYTPNTNLPDLQLSITDNQFNTTGLGNTWTWTLEVVNKGNASATFTNTQRILVDNLPGDNVTYTVGPATNENDVMGTGNPTVILSGNDVTVSATGTVTIGAGGSFDVVITATPTATGTFPNPRTLGEAEVDPDGLIPENYNNNSASDTVTVTPRYVTFTTDPNIPDSKADNFSVSGTGIFNNDTITVRINDSDGPPYDYTNVVTTTVQGGTWSVSGIDASGLTDGWIFYSVTEKNPGTGTVTGGLSAWPAVLGPPLAFTSAPNITDANVNNVSFSGTEAEAGDSIEIVVTNGTVVLNQVSSGAIKVVGHATVNDDGTWSTTGIDASTIPDGLVTYLVYEYSPGASYLTSITATVTKTTGVLAITTAPNITDDNKYSVSAAGTGGFGDQITVSITDQTNTTQDAYATVGADGKWSVDDIDATDLLDGPVTYQVTATNSANMPLMATAQAIKVTTPPPLHFTSTPDIDASNETSITVTGTGVPNYDILVNITDGTGDGLDTTADAKTMVDDDGTWSVSGIDASLLFDGDVTYVATEIDPAGYTYTIEEDADKTTENMPTQAPTVMMTAPAGGTVTSNNKPTLSASATDNSGSGLASVQFEYSTNGGSTFAPAGSPVSAAPFNFTFTTALADGAYDAEAIATDKDGNSTTSSPVSFTIDTVAPTVTMTAPSDGSLTNDNKPTLTATASDNSGGSGVASVQFQYSSDAGATWNSAATLTTAPYAYSFTTALADGDYQARAIATDVAGNAKTSAAVSFTIDTVAPTVDMTAPEDGSETTDDTPTLSATASDNTGGSGLASVQFEYSSNAGSTWTDVGSPLATGPFNFTFTTALADGDYQARAIATDKAGNTTTSSAVSFTIGNSAPTVAMTAPTNGSFTNNNKPTLTANATEIGGTGLKNVQFQYSTNGGSTWNNAGGGSPRARSASPSRPRWPTAVTRPAPSRSTTPATATPRPPFPSPSTPLRRPSQ